MKDKSKRVQVIIRDDLIPQIKRIQSELLLKSAHQHNTELITFTQVVNKLLEEKLFNEK